MVYLFLESKGNKIQHAEIKNATIALYVDSLATLDLKYRNNPSCRCMGPIFETCNCEC